MNWDLSEEQQAIRDAAAQVLGGERATWDELAKADLLGLCLPEVHGGSGHGIFELGLILETDPQADPSFERMIRPHHLQSSEHLAGFERAALHLERDRRSEAGRLPAQDLVLRISGIEQAEMANGLDGAVVRASESDWRAN